jgi:hypothetical protein
MYSKFRGNVDIIEIVANYDTKIVCPFLTIEEVDIYFGQVVLANDVILLTLKMNYNYFVSYLCDQKIMITPWFGGHNMQCNFHIIFLVR